MPTESLETRQEKIDSQLSSLDEPTDGHTQIAENRGQGEVFVVGENPNRPMSFKHMQRALFWVEYANDRYSDFEIFGDLGEHPRPSIIG